MAEEMKNLDWKVRNRISYGKLAKAYEESKGLCAFELLEILEEVSDEYTMKRVDYYRSLIENRVVQNDEAQTSE